MTVQEIKKTLSTLRGAFPNAFSRMSYEDGEALIEAWERIFKTVSPESMKKAVDVLITTKPANYIPSVADVSLELSKIDTTMSKYYKSPSFIKAVQEWSAQWDAGLDPITRQPRTFD